MKREFTYDEIMILKGCYDEEKVKNLLPENRNYSLSELMALEISVKDKIWFLYHSCNMTLVEKLDLCILLGKSVIPIYESEYPNDTRIRDCWHAIDKFRIGEITKTELNNYINSANSDSHFRIYPPTPNVSRIVYYATEAAADAVYFASNASNADDAIDRAYSCANFAVDIVCDTKNIKHINIINTIIKNEKNSFINSVKYINTNNIS